MSSIIQFILLYQTAELLTGQGTGQWLLITDYYWLLIITDYWLLITGYWLLIADYWLLIADYWLLIILVLASSQLFLLYSLYARSVAEELLVCRFCIILLCFKELSQIAPWLKKCLQKVWVFLIIFVSLPCLVTIYACFELQH